MSAKGQQSAYIEPNSSTQYPYNKKVLRRHVRKTNIHCLGCILSKKVDSVGSGIHYIEFLYLVVFMDFAQRNGKQFEISWYNESPTRW